MTVFQTKKKLFDCLSDECFLFLIEPRVWRERVPNENFSPSEISGKKRTRNESRGSKRMRNER